MNANIFVGFCLTLQSISFLMGGEGKYEAVSMVLDVPATISLGSEVNVGISLKSTADLSICSPATADLDITLVNLDDSKKNLVFKRRRLRNFKHNGITDTLHVKKVISKISPKASLRTEIGLFADLETRLSTGRYSIEMTYEGEVKSKAMFSVVTKYEETVPTLIALLASTDEYVRDWARKQLVNTTGLPHLSKFTTDTIKDFQKMKMESDRLKMWWQKNRELILLVEKNARTSHELQHRNEAAKDSATPEDIEKR